MATPLTSKDLVGVNLTGPALNLFTEIQTYRREVVFAKPRPNLIYHYTSPEGCRGILESNTFWATHVRRLNDLTEVEHGCEIVRDTLPKWRSKEQSPIVGEFLDCALTSFDLNEQLETYVASFSENGDLLSQWRGYGESARGFSIGMSFDTMCDLGGGGLKFFVCRTIYSRDKQQEVIDTIIKMTIDGLKRFTAGLTRDAAASSIRQCCKVFQSSLWMMLVLFKHPGFEEEREWRAIRAVAPDLPAVIKYRGNAVPYLELDFSGSPWRQGGRIPIRRIYHGPTADPHVVEEMKHLLTSHGHEQVTIEASQIPLRQVGVQSS